MSDKIDEIVKEIALKHRVALGKDDPILMLYTMNERLIRDMADAQQHIVREFQANIEDSATNWSEDARLKAERTINGALTMTQQAMKEALHEAASSVAASTEKKVNELISIHIEQLSKKQTLISIMNILTFSLLLLVTCLLAFKLI